MCSSDSMCERARVPKWSGGLGAVSRRGPIGAYLCIMVAMLAVCQPAPASADPDGQLHAAMEQFTASLQEAEKLVRQVPGLSEQDRAEGYQYVAGLVHGALDREFANSDVDHPSLRRSLDTFTKAGLDNPDNLYAEAQISDQGEYLISGTRGTAAHLAFQLMAGTPGDGSLGHSLDAIDSSRLQVNADGTYQITVSAEKHDGNWLKSGPGASLIILRQSFSDWTKENPGEVHIRRIGREGTPSQPLDAQTAASRLREAGRVVVAQIRCWLEFIQRWKSAPANALSAPVATQGGLTGQISSYGRYQLADDEALVVTLPAASTPYQGFQLGHIWWFISFDYATRPSSLSAGQARLSADGQYRFVISRSDPGVPNWLDTVGHREGFMFLRWQGLSGPLPPQPKVERVKLAELRRHLPADEPVITAAERQAQLASREAAVNRRFGQ